MPVLEEKRGPGQFIASEANGTLSRDVITVANGAGVVEPGTILGKVTASDKYVPHDSAASDGSEDPVAILYARVDATSADAEGVAVARLAEVNKNYLIYDGVAAEADVDAALLANSLIKVVS